jgi:hypothetical protein
MFQQPTMSWQPKEQTLLVQAVLQTSEGQRRYRERLMTLHGGLFKTESLQNRVNEIAARLRPILAADNPDALRDWEKEVAKLSAHIAERMKFLTEELALTAPATQGSSR